MTISKAEVSKILNLQTDASIGVELADRQLEAIVKGYAFLTYEENNVLYIADEVGLGKTYIAIGILTLFRHFAESNTNYSDLIIVPKSNLQVKWEKDISNFLSKNYLGDKAQVKGFIDNVQIKERIFPLESNVPLTIFRMTSFSGIGMRRNSKKELLDYLVKTVFKGNDVANTALMKAYKVGWFNIGFERKLRNLVAYLLNICSEKVMCVVIDEAHNYKYGPGEDHKESIRNETTARFLGAIRDKEIFMAFPELEKKVKFPLAEKVICLSATPKDRNIFEIKNQLSCFTNKHILSSAKDNSDVKKRLKKFLIRGNLEYILNEERYSRNMCTDEHRKGNVSKKDQTHIEVEDSFESVFWQLIQYQSIKYLNQKNNASFEIGMLAGFETYFNDIEKKHARIKINSVQEEPKEYEQVEHRNIRESQDINVVKAIVNSYKDAFDSLPPHPKQSKLISEIISQLKNQEKSLVFSRRVATVYELERSLTHRFEKEIVIDGQLNYIQKDEKFESEAIRKLVSVYDEREVIEKLDETLKIIRDKKALIEFFQIENIDENQSIEWLKFAFYHDQSFEQYCSDFIKRNLFKLSHKFKMAVLEALEHNRDEFFNSEREFHDEDVEDHEQSGYFFLDFFKEKNNGFSHRQKIYREDWFYLNIMVLNEKFRFINFNHEDFEEFIADRMIEKLKSKETPKQKFERINNSILEFLKDHGKIFGVNNANSSKNSSDLPQTFLTQLILKEATGEFKVWVDKRRNLGIREFLKDFSVLQSILINIFRNGGGLLLSYIVDQSDEDFELGMLELLSRQGSPFLYLSEEIRIIIKDFDLIVQLNFEKKDEGKINQVLRNLTPIAALTGQDKVDKGILAARFRMPGYPYALITTDIFREGEDLHTYCQNVYHYGIAWNPSDMQQRTGRIDRINSLSYRKLNQTQNLSPENKIHVFYPYLKNSVEVNQVIQLFQNVNKFIETFNEIEQVNHYETKVQIEKIISEEDIPQQIKSNLSSKYDVRDFCTPNYKNE